MGRISYATPLLLAGCVGLAGTVYVSMQVNGQAMAQAIAQATAAPAKPAEATPLKVVATVAPEPAAPPAADPRPDHSALAMAGREEACQAEFDRTLAANPIVFAHGRTKLDAKGKSTLDALVVVARACSAMKIEVGAHTDDSGKRPANLRLSGRRAAEVKAYLLEQGLSAGLLTAVGYGPDRPIASNRSEDGRARNRRIEFRIVQVESG